LERKDKFGKVLNQIEFKAENLLVSLSFHWIACCVTHFCVQNFTEHRIKRTRVRRK